MTYKFNDIRLDKGMYAESGKNFTQVLESLDPSENYKGTAYEGLDAYQRQLKRFDIRCHGIGSDMVEKFFNTTETAVLFPEYVSRSVKAGMEEGDVLSAITATTTCYNTFFNCCACSTESIVNTVLLFLHFNLGICACVGYNHWTKRTSQNDVTCK